jgi:acid stress-induced BolA-like protein IbaG/YrbA
MTNEDIESLIVAGIADCKARVSGDGTHFQAIVIAPAFAGLSMVKQHQLVYRALGDRMKGEIHALAIRTFTPEEWEQAEKLQVIPD